MIQLLNKWREAKNEERAQLRFCTEHNFLIQAKHHRDRMDLMREFMDEYEDLVAKAQKL